MFNQEYGILLLRDDAGPGKHWTLDRPEMFIGRHEDCDIVLDDRTVSRRHARITRDQKGYILSDLDSKNGTFVNGEPAAEGCRLQDGDDIQVAISFRLTFVDAGATAPPEQAIDALVRRLRERLAEVDPDWQYIVTVRGHGFRLSLP